jgi:hypothetical protein
MIKSSLFLIGVAAVAAGAYAFAQSEAPIVWKPKVGTTMKYKLNSTSEFNGMNGEFSAVITEKVLEIKPDGTVVIKRTTGETSMKMNGTDGGMGDMSSSHTITRSADGEILSRKADTQSPFDLPKLDYAAVILIPKTPIKVGETWTRKFAGVKDSEVPASETTYTYKGIEKLGDKFTTHRIAYSFKEVPKGMTITGTAWVNVEDGALLKTEMAIKQMEVMPGIVVDSNSKLIRIGSEGG